MILFERPWFKKIFLLTTVFSLLVGMHFVSRNLQDRLQWPEDFISQVNVIEASGVHEPSEVSTLNYFWLQKTSRKLKSLDSFLPVIGAFRHPITLEIDMVNSLRYDVSEDKVAIGLEVLRSSGQLERSLLKAWTMQNSKGAVAISALRQEVTADLLYGFFNGRLDLEDPVLHKSADFLKIDNDWAEWLTPLYHFCQTPWRPLELLTICESLRQGSSSLSSTPMMARPLIGSLVWSRYMELKWSERENFVRAFAETTHEPTKLIKTSDASWPRLPAEWRLFIESEARALAPSPIQLPKLPRNEAEVIKKSPQGWQLLPGDLPLAPSLLAHLKAKSLIWESCEQPSTSELLAASSSVRKILFVKNCDSQKIDYRSYVRGSLQNFAVANPQVKFIVFHRPSLNLFFQKLPAGKEFDLLSWILKSPRPQWKTADLYLGLSDAKWQKELGAYGVDGNVEAVEYFRQ